MIQNLHGTGTAFHPKGIAHYNNECFLLADLFEQLGMAVRKLLENYRDGYGFNHQIALSIDETYSRLEHVVSTLRADQLSGEIVRTRISIRQFFRGHITPSLIIQLESKSGFFLEAATLLRSSIQVEK